MSRVTDESEQGRRILRQLLELARENLDDAIEGVDSGDTETMFTTCAHFVDCVKDLTDTIKQLVLTTSALELDTDAGETPDMLRVRISAVQETHRAVNDSRMRRAGRAVAMIAGHEPEFFDTYNPDESGD